MTEKSVSSSGDPDHHFAPPPPPTTSHHRHARWPTPDRRRPATDNQSAQLNPKLVPSQSEGSKTQNRKSPQHSIVVVGVCSSGKSTLVQRLRQRGYRVRSVAQEHSGVPDLWRRADPDVLVYLDASIHTIRRRRRAKWRQAMLDEEHLRLRNAREHANLYIPTDGLAPEDVESRVVTFLFLANEGRRSEVRDQ